MRATTNRPYSQQAMESMQQQDRERNDQSQQIQFMDDNPSPVSQISYAVKKGRV
jgi:hypothetical protein